jgi:hypothetical protein
MDSDVLKVLFMMLSVVLAGVLAYGSFTFIRAFARRIEGRETGGLSALADQVDFLRQKVEEGEGDRARIVELEERLEFAERLLARDGERARLPGRGEAP